MVIIIIIIIRRRRRRRIIKCTVIRGGDIALLDGVEIQSLKTQEFYKYLGIDEKNGINDRVMKEKVKREYFCRVRKILKTQLNSKNKIMVINSLVAPVVALSILVFYHG